MNAFENSSAAKTSLPERDIMIKDYLPLVRKVAHRIARHLPSNIEVNDLISSGSVGLLYALERFDPSRGLDFGTFAEFRIKGAILDNLRAMDPVPRRSRQRLQEMERTRRTLIGKLGRMPNDEEMAGKLEMSIEEYHTMVGHLTPCMELSFVLMEHGTTALQASNASPQPSPHSELRRKELRRQLVKSIRKLPERERTVISLYYYANLSYKEIALLFDVTESRICQIHRDAVKRMRPYLDLDKPIKVKSQKKIRKTQNLRIVEWEARP
jgi:RNA polymerase sigma factor for flagellar operon FliA